MKIYLSEDCQRIERNNAMSCVGVPVSCPDVPAEVLSPRNTWQDPAAYDRKARELAERFNRNFKKYEDGVSAEVRAVAPKAG
ncbi:MAG: hypothetical protein ACR2G4_14620 [Pyrinomonadaceae bacterium]